VKLYVERNEPNILVSYAGKASEALRLLAGGGFDCVVSDYQMGDMDGVGLCTEIRRTSSIPFILYTGRGSEEVAERAFQSGVDDYVRKEEELSSFQVLVQRIRKGVEAWRSEDALAKSEQRYRDLLENLSDAVIVLNAERYLYANRAAADLLGFRTPTELVGLPSFSLVAPIDKEMVMRRTEARLRGEDEPDRYEITLLRSDGGIVACEVNASKILFEGKIAFLGIHRDITKRKKDEEVLRKAYEGVKRSEAQLATLNEDLASTNEALRISDEELRSSNEQLLGLNQKMDRANETLRVSEEEIRREKEGLEEKVRERTEALRAALEKVEASAHYTRNLIEASLDPLVTISREGLITDVNDAAVEITGVPRGQLIGTDFSGYFIEPLKAKEAYLQVFREGPLSDYPLVIRNTSGRLINVNYHAAVYRDRDGVVEGVFAILHDITRRLESERQREADHVRVAHAEQIEAVTRMGATVAHDLRGPLAAIMQSVNLAKNDPVLTTRMLQLIEENATRSLRMIADWRSSTREIVPQPTQTDLGSLIKNVLEGMTIPGNVVMATSVGGGLDSILLDPDIMHRVVDNLVKNAVEAMPNEGRLTVIAVREGDSVSVSVSDTGIGITEESGRKLFSPLYTTKSGGMGLGLTYCRRAVEAQGGTISFESEVGVGTTFHITVPTGSG
jgi:PAS domain S-box-containing protein